MCDENNEEETKRKKVYKKEEDIVLICCGGWDYIIYALGFPLWIEFRYVLGQVHININSYWALKVIGSGL
jgi:hypothetical protein